MGIASAIGGVAANALGKGAKEFVFGGAPHASWTDFYLNMALDLETPSFTEKIVDAVVAEVADAIIGNLSAENQKDVNFIRDNFSFAKQFSLF
jgi:hypothetical protein